MLKKCFTIIFCFLFFFKGYSQNNNFEGEIHCVKTTHSDTLYYVYSITDDFVRVDLYDKYNRSLRSFILNLQDKSVMVINPAKKLCSKLERGNNDNSVYGQKLTVISSGNYKYIDGYYTVESKKL